MHVWISLGYCSKHHKLGALQTIGLYCLSVQEAGNPKSRCGQGRAPSETCWTECFLAEPVANTSWGPLGVPSVVSDWAQILDTISWLHVFSVKRGLYRPIGTQGLEPRAWVWILMRMSSLPGPQFPLVQNSDMGAARGGRYLGRLRNQRWSLPRPLSPHL